MNLYGNPVCAIAGQKGGLQGVTESHIAGENIEMGAALFGKVGDERVFSVHQNIVALVASSDLVANNKLTAKVNDVELDAVDFVTDTDTTLSTLAEAINSNDELSEAGIGASVVAGTKMITIAGDSDVTASIVVTGGESQATFTATAATGMKFVGVAVHEERAYREGTGFYAKNTAVNVMTHGKIYVEVADGADVADKKAAYVVLSGADKGKFTDEASGNYDTGCVFCSAEQNGLALIEVNGLK